MNIAVTEELRHPLECLLRVSQWIHQVILYVVQFYSNLLILLSLIGNVFIADRINHRIRMVAVATDIISTVAGSGTGTYNGNEGPATSVTLWYPTGIAVDSSG